jgi:hypothetical protein
MNLYNIQIGITIMEETEAEALQVAQYIVDFAEYDFTVNNICLEDS